MVADVQIKRVHKSSPYNVSEFLPNIEGTNEDEIFKSPQVQQLIDKTFGKNLIISIIPIGIAGQKDFTITKNKAKCNN